MKHCAVIGNPIAHSMSPDIHQVMAKTIDLPLKYERLLAKPHTFEATVTSFFAAGGLALNVTAPFKKAAFDLATEHTPEAHHLRTCNTLHKLPSGHILGDNSDGYGFMQDLSQYITSLQSKRVLILGAGCTATTLVHLFAKKNLKHLFVSNRTPQPLFELAKRFTNISIGTFGTVSRDFDLVINTIPSHAPLHKIPLDFKCLSGAFCYDLNYGTSLTPFLELAVKSGAKQCKDGKGMLVYIAEKCFKDWHQATIPVKPILAHFKAAPNRKNESSA